MKPEGQPVVTEEKNDINGYGKYKLPWDFLLTSARKIFNSSMIMGRGPSQKEHGPMGLNQIGNVSSDSQEMPDFQV
jgi:hypothetical protein